MNDPSASRHGNFMNYYTFHSAEERATQLPRGVWRRPTSHQDRKYIGLDVGCNSGDLTMLLEKFLRREINDDSVEVHLFGIDIDARLINRAKEQQQHKNNESSNFISFDCLDFMEKNNRRTSIMNYLKKFSRQRFDVVFSFSITMWIHLNHGDDGLIEYLKTICSMGEIIVIEPQPWKCYRNASRRMRRAGENDFPLLSSIQLTGDVAGHIDRIILDVCSFKRVAISEANEWGRKLLIYERK